MKLKIVSDGTREGTKLIDENSGEMIHGVSEIIWSANPNNTMTKTTIKFFNIPVEIISTANINLIEWNKESQQLTNDRFVEKKIKIISENSNNNSKACFTSDVKILDETGDPIYGIQDIECKILPEGTEIKISKIIFDKNEQLNNK